MRRESWSVIGACALGAFIGTLVAFEIAIRFKYGSYFWGLGALLGGIVAYVAVDFRHFYNGVVHSYNRTIAWRPYLLYWRALWSLYVSNAVESSTLLAGFSLIVVLDPKVAADAMDIFVYTPLVIVTLSLLMSLILILAEFPELVQGGLAPDEYEEHLNKILNKNWNIVWTLNVVMFAIYGVRYGIIVIGYALRGLRYGVINLPEAAVAVGSELRAVIKASWKAIKVMAQFVAGVFIYVHSQRRTLCFVDAALGAAIGYTFGSAIIGAVAGAILGVINYELVSVRWLKLAPASR